MEFIETRHVFLLNHDLVAEVQLEHASDLLCFALPREL